jgi:hypothetical protein
MPDEPAQKGNREFSKLVSRFAFVSVDSRSAPKVAQPAVTLKRRREETGEEESKESNVQKAPKARKMIDISHLPPLQDRLVKYLDGEAPHSRDVSIHALTFPVVFCGCKYVLYRHFYCCTGLKPLLVLGIRVPRSGTITETLRTPFGDA